MVCYNAQCLSLGDCSCALSFACPQYVVSQSLLELGVFAHGLDGILVHTLPIFLEFHASLGEMPLWSPSRTQLKTERTE